VTHEAAGGGHPELQDSVLLGLTRAHPAAERRADPLDDLALLAAAISILLKGQLGPLDPPLKVCQGHLDLVGTLSDGDRVGGAEHDGDLFIVDRGGGQGAVYQLHKLALGRGLEEVAYLALLQEAGGSGADSAGYGEGVPLDYVVHLDPPVGGVAADLVGLAVEGPETAGGGVVVPIEAFKGPENPGTQFVVFGGGRDRLGLGNRKEERRGAGRNVDIVSVREVMNSFVFLIISYFGSLSFSCGKSK